MTQEERPWLSVYGGKLSDEPIKSTLTGFLEEAVQKYRDNIALTQGERRISYGELLEQTEKLAAAFSEAGIQKGDRVGLMLPNSPEYVIGFFGAARIGATVTQVNPIYTEPELKRLFNDSGSETVVVHAPMYQKVKKIQPDTSLERVICAGEPEGGLEDGDETFDEFIGTASGGVAEAALDPREDLAVLQYTGGTTGIPKGAMITHGNVLGGVKQTNDLLIEDKENFPENGKVAAVPPFFHNFGLITVMLFGLRQGWNLLLVPEFDPDEVMRLIKEEKPIMLAGVPTDFMALHGYPDMEEYGLDDILLYISAGQSLPVSLLESFEERAGRSIYEGYGSSEAGLHSFNTYLRGPVGGSVGVPIPGHDVKIMDKENREKEAASGEPGELAVKGPQVMKGYWQMPEETADDLRDGWFYTGDIVQMDEEGYLYVVDRKKDVIITSGYNVYPREVEEVLYQRSEVLEAVAVGAPDDYYGEVVKAFVVKKQGSEVTEEELLEHCKENLASYKIPQEIEFRDELPKSAVGKLLRRVLADEVGRSAPGSGE